MNILLFASTEAEQPAEGLAAFGVNWQMLLFQAITFLLVVLVLKKFVLGKLYDIIDARKAEIDDGLNKAEQAKKELASAQDEIDKVLASARSQAEAIVSDAKKESNEIVKHAEDKALIRAEAIVKDVQAKLALDITKARKQLELDTVLLVNQVAEVVLREKLDGSKDQDLITAELEKRREK